MTQTGVSAAAWVLLARRGRRPGGRGKRRRCDAAATGWSKRGAEAERTRSRGPRESPTGRADHASERGRRRTDPARPRRGGELSPWSLVPGPGTRRLGRGGRPSPKRPWGSRVSLRHAGACARPLRRFFYWKRAKTCGEKGRREEAARRHNTSDSARDSAPCGYSQPRASLAMPGI